jgi:hypothetical protein
MMLVAADDKYEAAMMQRMNMPPMRILGFGYGLGYQGEIE